MKEPWSISKEKLVALEEGTSRIEEHECVKPAGRNGVCKQAIQSVKLFLYLGLLMIVGWTCYSIWQPYHEQSMEVKVAAIIRELELQNLLLLQEQPTHETSTIAARAFSGSEDSKTQDVVDDLEKFSPEDQDEILNSENTESSLGWPTSTDYPDLPKAMNFPFFLPSFSSMKVDESEKEPGSSESAQGLADMSIYNISEESQLLEEDEKILLENYMLLSLLVQNSVRISEALKDSKEVVDPKFQLELEGFDRVGPELDNPGPIQWFSLDQLESQKEIGSDLKDPEETTISTQTDDNYESATVNTLNNPQEIVPEDSTEPEQEETLIKSNEQMHQSIDYAVLDWFGESVFRERKHEKVQSFLEKSTVRNAEASEDSTEEVDHNSKPIWKALSPLELKDFGLVEMKISAPLEFEDLIPFEWEYSDPFASMNWLPKREHSGSLESQKEIDSDMEESEEKTISTQTDDNYESATLKILNNTHEIVPEDNTEPGQDETFIKSNEQMHQSIDSADLDEFDQSASEDSKHEEEQATDETEAEIEYDEITPFPYNFRDSIENSDTDGSSLENESDEESESNNFDLETYKLLLNLALGACSDTSLYSWEQEDLEDPNSSYGSGVLDLCNARTKAFCEYRKQTLKFTDCSKYTLFRLKGSD